MKTYSTRAMTQRITDAIGPPTSSVGGVIVWRLGRASIRVRPRKNPARCVVETQDIEHDDWYAVGVQDSGDGSYISFRIAFDSLVTTAFVNLSGGSRDPAAIYLVISEPPYVPCIARARGTTSFIDYDSLVPLPDVIQSLAWGVLRGEVPAEMLLDAIKHDTEILG